MNTQQLKDLRNALSCWQDDYDCDDDKEQFDMFGAAIDAVSRLEAAELEIEGLKLFQELNLKIKQAMHERFTRAERERDELRAEQAEHDEQIARMESKYSLAKRALDSKTARCEKAEAELRRRDAAAGEAIGEILLGDYCDDGTRPASVVCLHDQADWENFPDGTKLYTAAPPAVLPEIDGYTHGLFPHAVEQLTRFRDDALALGAQQQKVVEFPKPHAHLIWIQAGRGPDDYWDDVEVSRSPQDRCCDGSDRYAVYSEFEVKDMLDAAGVKWEVKK